jgi:hypothetical protein
LYTSQFPEVAEKIRLKLAIDRNIFNPTTGQWTVTTPGVQFAANNFSTFAFGDYSDWRITTPKSGLGDNYIGAAGEANWYITQ